MTFAFWLASFAGARAGTTDMVVFSDSMQALGVLVDESGLEAGRGAGTAGSLVIEASPGRYLLMLDGSLGRHRNRYRGATTLPVYSRWLSTSSLLIAPAATRPERTAMIAAAARQLELSDDHPARVYAEVYGLAESGGRSRFSVTYTFDLLDADGNVRSGSEVALRFDRDEPASEKMTESLVIDPGQLQSGRYRLRLDVHDLLRDASSTSPSISFRLR
jgi:hypothetical protein